MGNLREILVLACSDGALAHVTSEIGRACPGVRISPFDAEADLGRRSVCGIVAVLEPAAPTTPGWVAKLRAALGRLERDDAFRIFLARHGLDEGRAREIASQDLGDGLTLEDSIQLGLSPAVPANAIRAFIDELPAIEDTRRWSMIRAMGLTIVSAAVTAVQVAAAAGLAALCVFVARGRGAGLDALHAALPAAAALAAGMLVTPLATAALCIPRWASALAVSASRATPAKTAPLSILVIGLVSALIYGVFFVVLPRLDIAQALFWLGMAGGLVADHLRREGWRVRREAMRFETGRAEDRPLRTTLGLPVFTLPLFSDWRPRVFLSYKHAVGSGARDAARVAQRLATARVDVFLDRMALRTGEAWRRALGRSLGGANVVVCFVDEAYLRSRMCRGELYQALWGARAGGTPVVVLMLDAGIRSGSVDVPDTLRPVLLGHTAVPGVILRTWQDADLDALSAWLTDRGWSSPLAVARGAVRLVGLLVANPLWWIGNTGFFLAWIAAPAAIALGAGWQPSLLARIEQLPVMMCISFAAGFVARLVLASRFSVLFGLDDPQAAQAFRRRLGRHHGVMAAALAALVVLLLRDATELVIGWCAVAYVGAFPLASAYTTVARDRLEVAAPS